MRTIAVLNQKGGVGKTTSTVNIAAGLARLGKKVALIDMDPQAHLTIHLGVNPETAGAGIYEVLTKSADINESLTQVRENLYLLGANINLVGAESELVSVVGREIILREAIETIRDNFDYLIIDCAPSLGLLTLNGLAAVNEVFIPLQPHFLALQGFGKLLQTVSLVSKRINPALRVSGILLCMYDTRATLSSEVKADIENFLENARETNFPWSDAAILPIFVRRNIKLAEAPSYGQTIFEYEPECNGSFDYEAIAKYVDTKMTKDGKHIKLPAKLEEITEIEPAVEETIEEQVVEEVITEQSAPQAVAEDTCDKTIAKAEETPQQAENVPIVEVPAEPSVNTSGKIEAIASNDLNTPGDSSNQM
ncbi:MAG: AAA family ATPase [Phycisphaerae bacterium]|nr:AAA family ATPase [Phycisphaerae bacterium]